MLYALVASLVTAGAGFALGEAAATRSTAHTLQTIQASLAAREAQSPVVATCPGAEQGIANLLQSTERLDRRIERLERPSAAPTGTTAAQAAPPAAEPPARTEGNEAALAEGERLLARASQAGEWTEGDARTLHLLGGQMAIVDMMDLRRRVLSALNEGTVKKAFRGSAL